MNKSSLGVRLASASFLLASATALVIGTIAWQIVSARIKSAASQEAARRSAQTLSTLASIDQLTSSQVQTGMRMLQAEGLRRGAPAAANSVSFANRQVPDLRLGGESQVGNYAVVDQVKKLAGGTATLFAFSGTDFVRVSTNVLKPDGSRAVGTLLDSKGKAYAALLQGQSFNGVVDILGVPYTTSYVPMVDANHKMVGAWYTGYRLDSIDTLGKSIEDTKILEHGFIALLKPSGAAVFHSNNVTEAKLAEIRNAGKGWVVHQETYPAWGYTVLSAYPTSDVWKQLLKTSALLLAGILVLVGAVVLCQFVLLKRLVIAPILHLSDAMANANLDSRMESDRTDEIGTLAESFNQFVARLRHTLVQVRDGSAASTAKSNHIRSVSNSTVSQMSDQLRCAEQASAAMMQLSGQITSTAEHTNEALQRAQAAADAAREGGDLVATTVDMIQTLAANTEQSASHVGSLSQRVHQIASIVGVIEEIASGTNLLALNASIEAARAGEQGRGFAVVAGEVRRLAERTAQATQEVSSLVNGIEAETSQAVNGILAASSHAKESAEAVAGLNSKFEQISQLVHEVDQRIATIASSAREEASAANSVSDTMHVVASSAKDSAGGARQVVDASEELLTIAQKLETMVASFQVAN